MKNENMNYPKKNIVEDGLGAAALVLMLTLFVTIYILLSTI